MESSSFFSVEVIEGPGQNLLLLPGWGQSIQDLRYLGLLMSYCCRVHILDLPGFGKAPAPSYAWASNEYANHLLRYLDAQHIECIDIAGHSFGGRVALYFAAQHPKKVRKLALLAASGLKRKRSIYEKMRLWSLSIMSKAIRRLDSLGHFQWHQAFIQRNGSLDYRNSVGVMRKVLVRATKEDLSTILSSVQAPTLLLWGAQDTQTPLEMAYRLNKGIPRSSLKVLRFHDHHLIQGVGAHLCAYHLLPFFCETLSCPSSC